MSFYDSFSAELFLLLKSLSPLIQIEVLLLFDVKLGVLASAEDKRSDVSLV